MIPSLLLTAFAAAVGLRMAVGGAAVAASPVAGLAFAGALFALMRVFPPATRMTRHPLLIGLLGAAFLLAPQALFGIGGARPGGSYLQWAIVVAIVATAEEAFLRGSLYRSLVTGRGGDATAIVVPAIAFAALHVPLYGWHIVPLDFTVGLVLGVLRRSAGTWIAPAVAHTVVDLAGWWLR